MVLWLELVIIHKIHFSFLQTTFKHFSVFLIFPLLGYIYLLVIMVERHQSLFQEPQSEDLQDSLDKMKVCCAFNIVRDIPYLTCFSLLWFWNPNKIKIDDTFVLPFFIIRHERIKRIHICYLNKKLNRCRV